MRRLRKKSASASTVDKATPENDAAAETETETAVVVVNTVITETVESEVVSQIEYRNDTTNGENRIKDDAVDAPADCVNELRQIASGEEVNEEIVNEGGVEGGDGIDDVDLYRASGGDGDLAINNVDGGEDESEDVDHDVEGELEDEDEDEENEYADDNNQLENENEEGDEEMENEIEEEDEGIENENEEEEDVEDLKASDDEGGQVDIGKEEVKEDNTQKEDVEKVNVGKEQVKEDNTMKEGVEKVNVGKEESKEDNMKKAGVKRQRGRLQKKGNPAGNTNGERKTSGGASGLTTEHKGGQSNPKTVIVGKADGEKAEEKIEGAEGGSPNKKRKKPKKKKKKNVEGGPNMEATKQEDNQELPPKGKPNKAKSMGMIFMCNTKTKNDCFRYKVFGLPSGKRDTVEKIYKGMRLFLYDVDLKLLYGIYKAAAPGGYNIQPKAFNSKYPSQVQFTVLGDCPPLPEVKFKEVLKDNYYTKKKFSTILTPKQVKDLCTLFNSNKHHGGDSKKLDKSVKRKPRDRVESPRYPRYGRGRERVVITPPVRAPARLHPPVPRAAPPPYPYDRALEDRYRQPVLTRVDVDYRQPVLTRVDDYRQPVLTRREPDYRQPVLPRRDVDYRQPVAPRRDDYRITRRDDYRLTRGDDYRQQQPLLLEDPYGREDRVVVQRRELRPVDEYRRAADPVINYRGGSGGYDPYSSTSYRERADTNGGVYVERDDGAVSVLPEYRSVRPRYQYY